jgi:hypothetical protein
MPAVRVDRYNAFGVNTVGLQATPFPLSISVTPHGDMHSIQATAARAYDLVDVLTVGAHPTAVVLNVGQNSWLADDYTPWPLSRIAEQQNVTVGRHDIRWAASSRFASDDLLTMPWQELRSFLDGWSPYDIEILDVPGPLDDGAADELALAVNTLDSSGPLLPRLPVTGSYFSGHDDCYLYVEAADPGMPIRLLTRLLALFAGSALLDDDEAVTIAEPEPTFAATLLEAHHHWIGTIMHSQPAATVTIGLTPTNTAWRLAEPIPTHAATTVTFDLATDGWRMHPANDSRPDA